MIVGAARIEGEAYSAGLNMCFYENAAARSRLVDLHQVMLLGLRCGRRLRIRDSSELAHEGIAIKIREVDTADVRIVKRAGSSGFVCVSNARTVEVGIATSVSTAAAHAGELRSLLMLRAEAMEQLLSRFRSELIVA